ncbi:FAD-dependent oxidoreductase [Pseudonocardia acaciae]|uniref:FAD-dependent oxidoreductase n=1 Tax=Pseudonocardia acaciae TaxID=551276 RepID=UPI000561A7F7|nr:FAD-dependent oxidoreductase [Pseudonocardia acaciae]
MSEREISAGDGPVVVIGAGPVGLAAAAHLVERELPFLVVDAGAGPGASVRRWGHVRLFSPWRYNIDPAARRLLTEAGITLPADEDLPTGADLVARYLEPLAALPRIAPRLRYGAEVVAIGRVGADRVRTAGREDTPFVVRLADGSEITARAVLDASGTWRTPNVLGGNGLAAHGEREAAGWIDHALPDVLGADRDRHAGRHTVVVGAGHSAATTLLALADLAASAPGTRITWAIRADAPDRTYGGGEDDQLPARGALGAGLHHLVAAGRVELATGFRVHTVRAGADGGAGGVRLLDAAGRSIDADRVVAATGYRPDWRLAGELRLELDPILEAARELAPLIDPNVHSCGTVYPHGVAELSHPEPGYFALGSKSYGRAPTFLMATGYEQARSVVAALAGDWAAARDVRLALPETGVCSVSTGLQGIAADLGLPADVPDQLMTATARHLGSAATPVDAVLTAAAELGLDPTATRRFAAFAAAQAGDHTG